MAKINQYPGSQKYRLVDSVRSLCEQLNRPISSKDLIAYWREHPEFRPLLTQAPGQILIKAARPSHDTIPRIYRVGIIGNLAFYAAEESSHWHQRLEVHRSILRVKWHNRVQIPWHAQMLLGSEHHAVGFSALTGFLAEWRLYYRNSESESYGHATHFGQMLAFSEKTVGDTKWQKSPDALVSRQSAEYLLRAEYEMRVPFASGESISVNKHLVRLAWPISPLFSETGFLLSQVKHYCKARWPMEGDDPETSKSLWRCMCYG